MENKTGYLVLNTGDVLKGKWLGDALSGEGEMVFNTAMTGYQEVMTDPSYAGQIVTMTYPLIGNYGFNELDHESVRPSLAGLIISQPCLTPSHYQSNFSVCEMVKEYNIPALYGVDTRALTRIIRENGEVYGKITLDPADAPIQEVADEQIVKKVSINEIIHLKSKKEELQEGFPLKNVVVIDYGYKHSITQALLDLGANVTVVPFDTPYSAIEEINPDGVVLSNGPGDPQNLSHLTKTIKAITENYPTLGICLGHQLIALAHGFETERLPYGHRGSNHPVKDLTTGKVWITSQNHGYVVKEQSDNLNDWNISHINVNDKSIEGLIHKSYPVATVQFHPEAHPGPIDSHSIFTDFFAKLVKKGEKQHA